MTTNAPNKENSAAACATKALAGEGHALRELIVSRRVALGDLANASAIPAEHTRARKPKGTVLTLYADPALRRGNTASPDAPSEQNAKEPGDVACVPPVQDALPNTDESPASLHPWRQVRCQTLGMALRKRSGVSALLASMKHLDAEPGAFAICLADTPDRAPVPSPLRYPLRRSNAARLPARPRTQRT